MRPLHSLLDEMVADPASVDTGLLVELVAHLRPSRAESAEAAQARLQILIDVLRARPEYASGLRNYLSALLTARNHCFLYADSGILANTGFFSELRHRLGNRILPPALDPRFLRDLVEEAFDRGDDAEWVAAIPQSQWLALVDALQFDASPALPGLQQIRQELGEALRVLACRLASLGLEPEMVRYYPALAEYESPFLAQQREIENVLAALRDAPEAGSQVPDRAHADVLLDQCREALQRIRKLSREAGAAVRLTWHLTRALQLIERMHVMLHLLQPAPRQEKIEAATLFFITLLRAECRRDSVGDLVAGVTELLSLQITEHASKTGEHYVTRGRGEFFGMFRAAAGAGVIVAFMALIKTFIAAMHLPPVWEALGFSLNYGLGFVLVHLLGFTIATKQPAMTAATLAASLDSSQNPTVRLEDMSALIVQVVRSQFIAIAGNVLLAFITSLLIAFAWSAAFGVPPVDVPKAVGMLHDIHPFLSLALPHAAIAGVCLFLSGLVSGYYDNKSIYNRVPDRLRRVKLLRKVLGTGRLDRLAVYVEHNLGALAGNFLFGFMLGCMGTVGFLLGLPLDIRHVTFAAANFAYGMQAIDFQLFPSAAAICALGVILIGMTNLAVSFALALNVALRSRRVRFAETGKLLGLVIRHFFRKPQHFFWPPAEVRDVGADA